MAVITSKDHVPNWMGLANTYGAFAAYRIIRDEGASEKYFENSLQGSYYHQVTNDTPLLYWQLKGINTTTENDKSANDNSGALTQPSPNSTVTGPIITEALNTALDFSADGLGLFNRTRCETEHVFGGATNPLMVDYPYTIECWVKYTGAREGPVLKLTGDNIVQFNLSESMEGRVVIKVDGTTAVASPDHLGDTWFQGTRFHEGDSTDIYFNDDEWHHIVVVFDTDRCDLSIDGNYAAAGTHASDAPGDSTTAVNLVVGEQGDFDGGACHVAMYDHALTRKQIRDHYTAATKCLDLEFVPAGDGTPGTGEIEYERLGKRTLEFPTGIRTLYGDKWADALVITRTTTGSEPELKAIGDMWTRPAHDACAEAGGSFAVLAGVISNDFASETSTRTIFDNLHSGELVSGSDPAEPVPSHNASGFSLTLSEDGQPIIEWGAKGVTPPGTLEELASTSDLAKVTAGIYSIVSGFNTVTPTVVDDATVGVLRDHLPVAQATGVKDSNMEDRAEIPQVGYHTLAGGVGEDFMGKIGPIILFASADMNAGRMIQIQRAIKGSNWPMRRRHSTRRPRRWYHLMGPSRP
jgi:hypothetical protein